MPVPPFGEPGMCPTIALFSYTTNQFLIGGAFPTELFRLRAWRAPKQTHGTEEARRVPAALTARAKQEGRRNDKKRFLALRESDW
jgi:hypothetical protein